MKMELSEQEALRVFEGRWYGKYKAREYLVVIMFLLELVVVAFPMLILLKDDTIFSRIILSVLVGLGIPSVLLVVFNVQNSSKYAKSQLAEFKAQEHENTAGFAKR